MRFDLCTPGLEHMKWVVKTEKFIQIIDWWNLICIEYKYLRKYGS